MPNLLPILAVDGGRIVPALVLQLVYAGCLTALPVNPFRTQVALLYLTLKSALIFEEMHIMREKDIGYSKYALALALK